MSLKFATIFHSKTFDILCKQWYIARMGEIINTSGTEVISTKEKKMVDAGLTREKSYRKIVDMMDAKVMTLDKFGGEHLAEDNSTQLRAAEMHLKMTGDIRPETLVDNRTVNISGVSAELANGLLHMLKDVASQLTALRSSGQQTGEIIDVEVS